MAADCLHEPPVVAFARTFGASIGIFGAAPAWLLNRFFGWCVWVGGRRLERHETLQAIRAEIGDNLRSERAYSGLKIGEGFLSELEADVPDGTPISPYVAVEDRNLLFEEIAKSLPKLPSDVIESVIGYYSASAGLTRQLIDFRSKSFKSISQNRQRSVIKDTFIEGGQVVQIGNAALKRIDAQILAYEQAVSWAYTAGFFLLLGIAYVLAIPLPAGVAAINAAVEWASTCDLAPKPSN